MIKYEIIRCEEGKYQPSSNNTDCLPCGKGEYNSARGQGKIMNQTIIITII